MPKWRSWGGFLLWNMKKQVFFRVFIVFWWFFDDFPVCDSSFLVNFEYILLCFLCIFFYVVGFNLLCRNDVPEVDSYFGIYMPVFRVFWWFFLFFDVFWSLCRTDVLEADSYNGLAYTNLKLILVAVPKWRSWGGFLLWHMKKQVFFRVFWWFLMVFDGF